MHRLEALHERAERVPLMPAERVVIFSDLHVGNGGSRDDFLHNERIVHDVLERFYLPERYRLVLNGDVEELQNFTLPEILRAWPRFYELLGAFEGAGRLTKIVGNHDEALIHPRRKYPLSGPHLEAARLRMDGGRELFVFHGHQASNFHALAGRPAGFLMRNVALPLGFRNFTRSHRRPVRFRLEKRVYDLSRRLGVAGVIGHTHRPVFESLSKADYLKIQIENLCRRYGSAGATERARIGEALRHYHSELRDAIERRRTEGSIASVYSPEILVPCLFNSGCAIGKRGITALEIGDGEIRLVHWFDEAVGGDHAGHFDNPPQRLQGTRSMRVVLRSECLQYIFARIKLLSDTPAQAPSEVGGLSRLAPRGVV